VEWSPRRCDFAGYAGVLCKVGVLCLGALTCVRLLFVMHACMWLTATLRSLLWPVLSLNRGYTAKRSIPKRAAGGTVNPAGGYVFSLACWLCLLVVTLLLYLLIARGLCSDWAEGTLWLHRVHPQVSAPWRWWGWLRQVCSEHPCCHGMSFNCQEDLLLLGIGDDGMGLLSACNMSHLYPWLRAGFLSFWGFKYAAIWLAALVRWILCW